MICKGSRDNSVENNQSSTNVNLNYFVLKKSMINPIQQNDENIILPGEYSIHDSKSDNSDDHNTVQVVAIDVEDDDEFIMP